MRFFDLHCDTLYRLEEEKGNIYTNNFDVSIEKSEKYNPYIGCFAVWVPEKLEKEHAFNFFNRCKDTLELQYKMYGNKFRLCKSKEDLEDILVSKKPGVILTIENSSALDGNLDNVKYRNECGVKIVTLTWNGKNDTGDGSGIKDAKGITNFGKKLVRELEKYNIIVDISHASDKLFDDVCSIAHKPFIATHSNSRSVCNHRRNLTDEQFNCIKIKGGIVGITFCSEFLNDSRLATFDDILRHVDYFLAMSGEDVLSIGSDFDGATLGKNMHGLGFVEDLYEYFLIKNYKESLLDKIFFSNAFNFIKGFY